MIDPDATTKDGFTRDFDALIDTGPDQRDGTITLALVKHPQKNPYALDLSLEHTPNHEDCPACKSTNSTIVVTAQDVAQMTFEEADRFWRSYRRQDPDLRPRTHETTDDYLEQLKKYFENMRLADITPGHLRGYQIARLHNTLRRGGQELHPWKHKAGHSIINHELSVVGQILTFARLWHRIKPYYFPFPQKSWSPRTVLSEEDEEALWLAAAKHPEASLAYWVAAITNNTTAAGIELRGLRLKNLFLTSPICEIYIPEDAVKNESRPRRIALNSVARWAVGECLKRAIKLGSTDPDHYLFPFCEKRGQYDPTRPASRSFLRKSWDKLRKATGFVELRPHDLRHQCITKLLENGNNPETVIAIAGHVGRKMLEYYAHQRRTVKYAAVMTLEAKRPVRSVRAKTVQRQQA